MSRSTARTSRSKPKLPKSFAVSCEENNGEWVVTTEARGRLNLTVCRPSLATALADACLALAQGGGK